MENIKFKNYTPPKPPADIINLTIGVFFDGTKKTIKIILKKENRVLPHTKIMAVN